MRISSIRIKNYKSIKDSGDVKFTDNLFVLAGQNESGKSSILEALNTFETEEIDKETLNFELENVGNLFQEISCTYVDLDEVLYKQIIMKLFERIKLAHPKRTDLIVGKVIEEKNIRAIKEITIKKEIDFTEGEGGIVYTSVDERTLGMIKKAILTYEIETEGQIKSIKPFLNVDVDQYVIAEEIWRLTPDILLFNDFTDLLPDKILLSELRTEGAQGVKAVNNVEKLINTSFEGISQKNTPQKISTSESESQILSANFQKDWKQKIYGNNKVNIKFFIENNEAGVKELSFFVETKDNEYLAPRKRSKGMIWFLSLWFELKAKENGRPIILLFDEPGLHLHIKANKDMLAVFHKLIEKGHQVIYSTHSPSLIETDKLNNIGLVINHEKSGTLVEGLTTTKLNTENKKDALQPIAEAMGMEPLKDFSILRQRNVIVEGLSDFWILRGMRKILHPTSDYEFIPGIGIKGTKIFPLISFCIGYNLDWVLVMDNGEVPKHTREELKENLFFGDEEETLKKILLLPVSEIENLFDVRDIKLIDSTFIHGAGKTPIELIGPRRKVVFSRMFYTKVENGQLKKTQFQPKTIKRFEEIFNWIDNQLSVK